MFSREEEFCEFLQESNDVASSIVSSLVGTCFQESDQKEQELEDNHKWASSTVSNLIRQISWQHLTVDKTSHLQMPLVAPEPPPPMPIDPWCRGVVPVRRVRTSRPAPIERQTTGPSEGSATSERSKRSGRSNTSRRTTSNTKKAKAVNKVNLKNAVVLEEANAAEKVAKDKELREAAERNKKLLERAKSNVSQSLAKKQSQARDIDNGNAPSRKPFDGSVTFDHNGNVIKIKPLRMDKIGKLHVDPHWSERPTTDAADMFDDRKSESSGVVGGSKKQRSKGQDRKKNIASALSGQSSGSFRKDTVPVQPPIESLIKLSTGMTLTTEHGTEINGPKRLSEGKNVTKKEYDALLSKLSNSRNENDFSVSNELPDLTSPMFTSPNLSGGMPKSDLMSLSGGADPSSAYPMSPSHRFNLSLLQQSGWGDSNLGNQNNNRGKQVGAIVDKRKIRSNTVVELQKKRKEAVGVRSRNPRDRPFSPTKVVSHKKVKLPPPVYPATVGHGGDAFQNQIAMSTSNRGIETLGSEYPREFRTISKKNVIKRPPNQRLHKPVQPQEEM